MSTPFRADLSLTRRAGHKSKSYLLFGGLRTDRLLVVYILKLMWSILTNDRLYPLSIFPTLFKVSVSSQVVDFRLSTDTHRKIDQAVEKVALRIRRVAYQSGFGWIVC